MRSRSVFALVTLCLGVLAGPGAPAGAAPPPPPALVHVRDANTEYFLPSIVSVRQGGTVEWDFQGLHTATDNTGMGLYDSGEIKDATFSYRFVAAGTYAVICTLHENTMIGSVGVPVRVAPAKGTTKTRFAVTWSATLAPAGFLFDVGKQRVGGAWSTWQSGVTTRSATFRPWRKGKYRFRARLRQISSGKASGWSPLGVIVVG